MVKSDQDIKFHLHGYDIEGTVTNSDPLTLEFVADATGIFLLLYTRKIREMKDTGIMMNTN